MEVGHPISQGLYQCLCWWCVCACVCAYVRACMRACVRACVCVHEPMSFITRGVSKLPQVDKFNSTLLAPTHSLKIMYYAGQTYMYTHTYVHIHAYTYIRSVLARKFENEARKTTLPLNSIGQPIYVTRANALPSLNESLQRETGPRQADRQVPAHLVSDVFQVSLEVLFCAVEEPLRLQVRRTEGQKVDGREAGLLARRDKDDDGELWRVL